MKHSVPLKAKPCILHVQSLPVRLSQTNWMADNGLRDNKYHEVIRTPRGGDRASVSRGSKWQ